MSSHGSPNQSPHVSFERERGVHALQITRNVAHVVISVGDDALRSSRILQVFRTLSESEVAVFLVKMHRTAVTLAFAGTGIERAETALTQSDFRVTLRRDLAVVAIRAESMRDLSGVMVEISDALYTAGALLYETGDSHNSVLCLIDGDRVAPVVEELRQRFGMDADAVHETSIEAEAEAGL